MRATVSSVTCGAKAAAYCERSVRPAIISVNQRIAHAVRAASEVSPAGCVSSARASAIGPAASTAISRVKLTRRSHAEALVDCLSDIFIMPWVTSTRRKGRPKPPPFSRGRPSAAAALDRPQRPVLDLFPQERDRIAWILEVRDQVGRGAADEAPDVRELHDRLVELDHDRRDQREHPAVVLSSILARRRLLDRRRRGAVERHVVFLI